jgi:Tfp pilus assembly protein PilN
MRVNLLPYQEEQKTGTRWATIFTLLGAILLVAVTVVFYLAMEGQVRSYEDRIAGLEREYQNYLPALQRKAELDQLLAMHSQKSDFVSQLSGEGVKWNLIMDELRKIIPLTVVVDSIEAQGEAEILIKGRAGSWQAISHFMVNIQNAKTVTRPDLHKGSWKREINAFEFEMTCEAKEASSGG